MSSITTQGRGLPPGTQQNLEELQARTGDGPDIGTGSKGGKLDQQALQILAQDGYELPTLGNYKSSSLKLPEPRTNGSQSGNSLQSTSTGQSTAPQTNVSDYIYAVGLINVNSATNDAQNSTNLANELSAYRQQLFENANQQMTKAAESQSSANSAAKGAEIACAVITAIFGVALLITGVGAAADAGLFAAEAGVDAGLDAGVEGGIEMTEFASEGSEGMSNLSDVGDMSELEDMDEVNPEEDTPKEEPESTEKTTEEESTKETEKEEETQENEKTNDSDSSVDANNEEMEANQKNTNYERFKRLLQAYSVVNSIIQGSLHIAMAVDQYHANENQAESQFDTNLAASMNTVESSVLKSMDGYLGDVSTSLKESGSTLSGMVSAIGGMMHAPSPI